MSAWPKKEQFQALLGRLAHLETKTGQDTPWAFIDHFDYDGPLRGDYYYGTGNHVVMRNSGSDYSGIVRLAGDGTESNYLSYMVDIDLFLEIEFRFYATARSYLQVSSLMRNPYTPSWNVDNMGKIGRIQETFPIQPAAPDVWHTWRITVSPNKLTLTRSDGPTSELVIDTVNAGPHGQLQFFAAGRSDDPNVRNVPFQIDVDYLAWRPLPEAPLPPPPMVDA